MKLPTATKKRKIPVTLRCSRSFKVTDFDNNQKPIFDFVLLNNTHLHPISHRFQVTVDYWSNFPFRQRAAPLFNTLVWVKSLNSRLEIRSQETRNSALSYAVKYELYCDILNRLGVDHECD